MSGLVKPKEYKLSESNIANMGSDLEKQVKKAAAETEDAWKGCGKNLGLEIWRIEKFKVVRWPKEQYGQFYSGDSYIVLHTYEKDKNAPKNRVMKDGKWVEVDGALGWDVHFWLGQHTSQDEAGTAAYKTVELDDYLDGAPIQFREAMGHESERFLSYWPKGVRLLEGGVDSGFKKVQAKEYKPRLMHVKGKKNCRVIQCPELNSKQLNSGDVFILDNGLEIIQWNGNKSSVAERRKAADLSQAIAQERGGLAKVKVNEEDNEDESFWKCLGGKGPIKSAEEGGSDDVKEFTKVLFRLSDASGSMKFTKEAEGPAVKKNKLDSNDVFILDVGAEVFTWVGKGATKEEKNKALGFAQQYLNDQGRPAYTPISRVLEGGEPKTFDMHF